MSVIYIKEQGAYLQLRGGRLVVTKGTQQLLEYPLLNLDNVVCFGKIQITTQLLHRLLEDGIDVSYFSYNGRYLGHTCSETSKNIFLRFSQYEYYQNLEKRLAFARVIVENKIYNQIAVIKKYRFDKDAYDPKHDLAQMMKLAQSLSQKQTDNEIMGIEGLSSNIYFGCFKHMLKCEIIFENRNRRPPKDPVNAILSLAYTFLTKDMCTLLDSESFETYLGFLHGIRYGRKSLALDMIEEWRQPIVDRLVIRLFNLKILSQSDFVDVEPEGIHLTEDGFKKFCQEYEKYMNAPCINGKSFRILMKQQVAKLKKGLQEGTMYTPFRYDG